MPRPRRAAAARASSAWKPTPPSPSASTPPSKPSKRQSKPSTATPPSPASRRSALRRASFRSGKRAPRSLSRRRADFDRIAAHHVAALLQQARPSSSATELPSDQSQEIVVELTPAAAQEVLDRDEQGRMTGLKGMLSRLRGMDNLSEEGEGGAKRPSEADDLHGLAEVLSAERFVSHDDSHVRLLVACALAELLRISAPEPPVAGHKLREVCSLFVEQLAVVVSPCDDMEADRFSLLEQLATVKAFVLFSDEEDVVCDLFACFYAVARKHQAAKVREYFADVLFSLLNEMDDVGSEVLDALLAPLVPSLKYSQPAVALAEKVMRMAANKIQIPLCSMLNASIRQLRQAKSASTPEKQHGRRRRTPIKKARASTEDTAPGEVSVHHEHIADIIIAVNRISSDVLIYVIPSLEDRIRSEDEGVRLANVHLLARLFTAQHDMSESYPSLFAEFLSRNRDVSPGIRAEVCAMLPRLMTSHAKHREASDRILRERALDREENVRLIAVQSIGAAVDVASEELLKILATRLRDRKASVRHEALKQLVQMYNATEHTSKKSVAADEEPQTGSDPMQTEDSDNSESNDSMSKDNINVAVSGTTVGGLDVAEVRMRKLRWLPNTLMEAHIALKAASDVATASEIEWVIFEGIPGSNCDDGDALRARLRRFATFLGGLHDTAFMHLVHLTQERRRTRDALLCVVEHRLRSRKTAPTPTVEESGDNAATKTFSKRKREAGPTASKQPHVASEELRQLARTLSRFLHVKTKDPDEAQKLSLSLATAVDLKIFEKIRTAVDEKASQAERLAACQDAISRLGSKSPTGLFLQDEVFRKCLSGVFSSLHFAAACNMAVEEAKLPRKSETPKEPNESLIDDDECPLALCGIMRYLDVVRAHAASLLQHNMKSIRSLVSLDLKDSDSSSDVIITGFKLISGIPAEATISEDLQGLSEVFESNMFAEKLSNVEQGTNLAKWATRAVIRLNAGENPVTKPSFKVVQDLALRLDVFTGDVESIVAPLTALSQMAKHSPKEFKPAALECFDFARALLCGSLNGKVNSFAEDDGEVSARKSRRRSQALSRRSSIPSVLGEDAYVLPDQITQFRASSMAELVHRAVKLLVYALSVIDSNNEELDDVFEILLKLLLEKRGDVFGVATNELSDSENKQDAENEKEDTATVVLCAMSRLSAGRGMLYLARHPKFFRRVSPPLVVSTVLLAQDERPDVRMNFAKTVSNQILKKRLPFRWVVALPLMALEPDRRILAQVKSMMTSLFRHRRRIYDKARLGGSAASIQLLPESALPDMIWVLANLPDVELDREAGFGESEKCLELMLDRLLESNEYAGLLNEYIEGMSIAQDATEPEDGGPGEKTERISELGRRAGVLLKKKQAGKKWNLSEHPGRISLPKDMFRVINRNAETSGVPPPSLLAVAKMYDKDKVRVSAKKEKPNNLVARIKMAGTTTSAASSVPEQKPEPKASPDESISPVAPGEEAKARKSPADSIEPLEEIEQDSEPIEMKMGEALDCDFPVQNSYDAQRGRKRLSHELEKSTPTSEENSGRTGSGKKQRSGLKESTPKSEARSKKTASGRKRGSGDLDKSDAASDEQSVKAGSGKKRRSGDLEKPRAVTPSAEAESAVKADPQKAEKSSRLPSEEASAKATGSPSDTKENEAGNTQADEGQSRRTLPRGKQHSNSGMVGKSGTKAKQPKKAKNVKAGDGKVPVVRRSSRRRRI